MGELTLVFLAVAYETCLGEESTGAREADPAPELVQRKLPQQNDTAGREIHFSFQDG